jgi:hypothetical protein
MMAEACSMHGKGQTLEQSYSQKPEGKKPLRRSGRNGRIILNVYKSRGWECGDWIYLSRDRNKWPAVLTSETLTFIANGKFLF